MNDMPSKGAHIAMTVAAFLLGSQGGWWLWWVFPLWGVLSLIQLIGMCKAINRGDVVTAQASAKKIKIFTFIGIGLNVLIFIFIVGYAVAFS